MAVRYFDLNGATAGFGTLTGAWDTTSAFWSTSSAGTVAPTAYTFTNADTAQFGFTGTTATAGTATISTGITVTLNSITTANLAGLQTIAAAGTGAITLAGTTPSVVVGSAGGLTISAPIGGTAGLAFSGGNVLTLSGANTFTGAFTQSAGTTRIGNAGALGAAGATLALSGGTISSSSTTAYTITNAGASTISGDITLGNATNTGALTFTNAFGLGGATRTLTIASAVTLSGVIGTVSDGGITKAGSGQLTLSNANTFTGAFSGSAGTTVASTATAIGAAASTAGISSTGTHTLQFSTAPTYSGRDVTLSGSGPSSTGALRLSFASGTATFKSITLAGGTLITQSASGTMTLTTGATAIALGANTLTLQNENAGTFTVPSQISGSGSIIITAGSGGGNIISLSATNSNFTGTTTITGGVLTTAVLADVGVVSSIGAPAIGSATISIGNGSNIAELRYTGTANVSTNRVINLAGTTGNHFLSTGSTGNVIYSANITATGSGVKNLCFGGSSTGITVVAGVVPDSAGGATGILANTGIGYLSGTANTYTGPTAASAGTLQFNSIRNVGAGASSLGNPALANATISLGNTSNTGTIRYLGTGAASSDRVINLAGTTGGGIIEASGTGTLTFTSALTATGVGAKTFTLGGFTSGVFSGAITNASGNVISLTKSGPGSWSIPSASNTFTGNVSITGGPLTIEAANRLGGATKSVTISVSYRNASLVLAGTGDTLASTTTLSVGSAGLDNFYFPQGAIKATADWTVAGAITQTTSSAFAADGGNLTLTGLISAAANTPLFRAAAGRTLYINGGLTGTVGYYFLGPGTGEWKANASNTGGSAPVNISGATLRLVTDGAITNPFGSLLGFSFGVANATGTGNLYARHAYTGGVAEIANTGATGNVALTLTGTTSVQRGTATMRLNRASTAGALQVNVTTLTAPTLGLFYWEYAGTPGTVGTDSKFVLTSVVNNPANTRVLGSVISNGSALVPAYRDTNKTVIPMVYDGSQATVLATQAGGSSLTSASGTTNHNISANITAQPSTTISSLRMEAGTSLTLTSGSILETALLMDMGTSAGTVLSGGRLARSRSQSAELITTGLPFYTANTNGTGSTIASNIDLPYGTIFTKAGPGLVTHTGAISKLSLYNLAEGNAVFSSAGSFSGEYTGITFATPATGTNSLTLGTSGAVSVGYLRGGGANTTLALTGGDLKLTATTSGEIYAGNITRSGSQKLILRTILGTTTSASQALSGSIDVASLDIQRGTLALRIETGASLASAIPVNFTGVGQINIGATTPAPIGADYSLAFGSITVTQGLGRILLQSVTSTSNFYATRLSTSAVPTVVAEGAIDLLVATPNTLTSFTVTGASTGPMGINWFNGPNRAYYRAAGSTLSGGGTTPVATVDVPIYGTDANFPAIKSAGVAFTAAPTDNVYVGGTQSAQTSVTIASLRVSGDIVMASSSARITTGLVITSNLTLSGGELAGPTADGRLYLYNGGNGTISSNIVDNVGMPTRVLVTGQAGVTLSGTNTFSGGLALLGSGSVNIVSNANLGTGSIDSYGGDLNLASAGSNTITKNIAVYDGGLYLTGNAVGVKLSGVISGTGDVFVAGSGLTLQGANTNNGTLRLVGTYLADATSLSNFAGIDFQGGNFRATSVSSPDISSIITARPAGNINITNTSGADYVLASSFGNSSTFVKPGVTGVTPDRVTLAAENYFNAATIGNNDAGLAVGAVRAAATNALGWGTVTVNTGDPTSTGQGAALELVGNITLPNLIILSGKGLSGLGAIRNVSGSNTLTGLVSTATTAGNNTRISADIGSTLTLSGGIGAGGVVTGRIVEFYGAGTTVETGVIGSGSLISVARPTGAGAGVTQLLSANTYSGGTTLTEGTIFAGNQTALGTGSVTMASGTTLQSGTTGGQNGKLTITGTLTNNGGTIRIGG